jgi:cytochrome c oxidase cbb3-type subunit IV
MYKEVLSGIQNVGVYPSFSFVVFFVFFTAIAVWLFRSKKSDFDEVSNIPLNNND